MCLEFLMFLTYNLPMGMFREIPPTAGFPLYLKDLLSVFSTGSRQGSLEEDFKKYLNTPYAYVTSSGTAAFYLILEALKSLSGKKTVVIPSFICPLVPLAIKRAGLKVYVCDIGPGTLDFDYAQLNRICRENGDILAIVALHLAGIPADMDRIKEIALAGKIFVIEDAAQALGAEYKGKKTGSFGDFSFFSLARGKGLTMFEGGLVITREKEYAKLLEKQIEIFQKESPLLEALRISQLLGYWVLYRPFFFWFIFTLPHFFWSLQKNLVRAADEYFSEDFPIHKVSNFRKQVAHSAFTRLEEAIDNQRNIAQFYNKNLFDAAGVRPIQQTADIKATYPYFVVILDNETRLKKVKKALARYGAGPSQVYALAINDYDYLKNFVRDGNAHNARALAQNTLTLSTSIFLKRKDLKFIIEAMRC